MTNSLHKFTPQKHQTKKEYTKQWRIQNRERVAKYSKEYRLANKKKLTEYDKQRYLDNKEKILEQHKQHYWVNRKEEKERCKQYYLKNKKERYEYLKQYRRSIPGKMNLKKHAAKRRQLGFIPLNIFFKGYHAHHISENFIIYIPEEIHNSIYHNIWTWQGMNAINKLAVEWL